MDLPNQESPLKWWVQFYNLLVQVESSNTMSEWKKEKKMKKINEGEAIKVENGICLFRSHDSLHILFHQKKIWLIPSYWELAF